MRAFARHPVRTALVVLLAFALAASVAWGAPARLRSEGWPLAAREADALFAPAVRAPASPAALDGALARAVARLQGAGWHDAVLEAVWSADSTTLTVRVASGTRWRWGTLSFEVPRAESLTVARTVAWTPGAIADPAALALAVDAGLREAEERGHAWAQLAITEWRPDSGRVHVRLSGSLGPRVEVERVRVDGLRTTRPEVASRALGPLAGLPYNPVTARAGAARLSQLGVFTRAEYVGLEPGTTWERGTLAFRVEEPRYNRFEGALGVQGSAGLVGRVALDLDNLLGTARAASLLWQSRGAGRSDFEVRYVEPFLVGTPFRGEFGLAQQLQDSTYTRTRWGVRMGHALGTGDRIEAGYEEERVVRTQGGSVNAALRNTVFAWERDGRDDRVSPRSGARLRLAGTGVFKRETFRAPVAGEPATRSSRAGIAEAALELHRPLGPRRGLALELSGTGRFSGESVLEDYERTPVGGARTLRGHDEEEFRVDRVALSRLELRAFPGSVGERIALFWDHAEMLTREPLATSGTRAVRRSADGLGFGLRLVSGAGLVDVDYGVAPRRGVRDGRLHLRLVSTF